MCRSALRKACFLDQSERGRTVHLDRIAIDDTFTARDQRVADDGNTLGRANRCGIDEHRHAIDDAERCRQLGIDRKDGTGLDRAIRTLDANFALDGDGARHVEPKAIAPVAERLKKCALHGSRRRGPCGEILAVEVDFNAAALANIHIRAHQDG